MRKRTMWISLVVILLLFVTSCEMLAPEQVEETKQNVVDETNAFVEAVTDPNSGFQKGTEEVIVSGTALFQLLKALKFVPYANEAASLLEIGLIVGSALLALRSKRRTQTLKAIVPAVESLPTKEATALKRKIAANMAALNTYEGSNKIIDDIKNGT